MKKNNVFGITSATLYASDGTEIGTAENMTGNIYSHRKDNKTETEWEVPSGFTWDVEFSLEQYQFKTQVRIGESLYEGFVLIDYKNKKARFIGSKVE